MAIWRDFCITCSTCGHRNRPHPSPREGVKLALLGQLKPCRSCGRELRPQLSDRPLVRKVRAELVALGLLPAPGRPRGRHLTPRASFRTHARFLHGVPSEPLINRSFGRNASPLSSTPQEA